MYCSQCGNQLSEGSRVCSQCGTPVAAAQVMPAAAPAPGRHDSFEYERITVKSDLATVATDCYESMGFELTGARESASAGTTALAFRRSRKVRGKAQLAKLRRTADDLIVQIASLEGEKTRRGRLVAISAGIVAALILGVGMCCTMVWTDLMAIGVVVGIIGLAACVAVWPLYRSIVSKDTARVAPRIEAAYDQLATVCEESQAVLQASA